MKRKISTSFIILTMSAMTGCGLFPRAVPPTYPPAAPTVQAPNNNTAPTTANQSAASERVEKYTVIVAENGVLKRTEGDYEDQLTWVLTYNGETILERNAKDEYAYTPWDRGEGEYSAWLEAGQKRVSNIVKWTNPFDESTVVSPDVDIPEPHENTDYINEYTLTCDGGLVTRTSGTREDSLTWVIEVDGVTKLQRGAENEFSYRPMDYGNGKYSVHLKSFIDGGYKRVSNIVEWNVPLENADGEASDDKYLDIKTVIKSTIKNIDTDKAVVEFKRGFIIDPYHDGNYAGYVFFAGTSPDGEEVQMVLNRMTGKRITSTDYGEGSTLYIWCDEVTAKDYIVCIKTENDTVTATDCCTGETIYVKRGNEIELFGEKADESRISGNNWYTYTADSHADSDHFFVSTNGKAVLERA